MKFRKKPVVIDAWQWRGQSGDRWPDWMQNYQHKGTAIRHVGSADSFTGLVIPTLEGWIQASFGDWIIRGIKGEVYPCKPDIFEATYEAVE